MYEIKYSLILVTIKITIGIRLPSRQNIHGDCMPITNVVNRLLEIYREYVYDILNVQV